MKNFQELQNFDIAFKKFIRQTCKNKSLRIRYHSAECNGRKIDTAYLGYLTEEGGRYGLHFYDGLPKSYKFGTRGGEKPWSVTLNYEQINKIPVWLKTYMAEVIQRKKGKSLVRNKIPKNSKSEWISSE